MLTVLVFHTISGQSRSRRRIPSGFTYISGCVKYTMFLFNFLFWLVGALLIAVGTYAGTLKILVVSLEA